MTLINTIRQTARKIKFPCLNKPEQDQTRPKVDRFEAAEPKKLGLVAPSRTLPLMFEPEFNQLVEDKIAGLEASDDARRIKSMPTTEDGLLRPRANERFTGTPEEELNREMAIDCMATGIPRVIKQNVSHRSAHLALLHAEVALHLGFANPENRKVWAFASVIEDLLNRQEIQK